MPTKDRLDFLTENWAAVRPDLDISPWGVWGRTTRINELFRAEIGKLLQAYDLTYSEFQTLGALLLNGPPFEGSPGKIARFNLLTSGGMANLLARMQREGLIMRRADPEDGRGVLVSITEHGRERFNAAVEEENRAEHAMLKGLTPEEKEVLKILLRKLLLSIDPHEPGKN